MAQTKRRYTNEEIARRGDEIYDSTVQPKLKKKDIDRFVAIDVETGEFEIGDTEMEAYDRLHARVPNAQTWLRRAGRRYLHTFGGRELSDGAQ
jgi:hypothetical protein